MRVSIVNLTKAQAEQLLSILDKEAECATEYAISFAGGQPAHHLVKDAEEQACKLSNLAIHVRNNTVAAS